MNSLIELLRYVRVRLVRLLATSKLNSLCIDNIPRVLIVAPHPDDEVIGCSGLMQHLLKAGKDLYIVILTGGEGSHGGCCSISEADLIAARRDLAIKANVGLGGMLLGHLYFMNYSDGNIHYEDQETKKLAKLIQQIQPNAIFIPHKGEGWSDHLQARNIISKLTEKKDNIQLYEYCVWFWYYNTWSIDWKNAFLVSMNKEEHLLKNKAIDAYILPKASCRKPWSGVLPKAFVYASRWNKELYFRMK